MLCWCPRTRAQCGSQLWALAAFARSEPQYHHAAVVGLLAERASSRATASALRGIILAMRTIEDLQSLQFIVCPLHCHVAASAVASVMQKQKYLPPKSLLVLAQRAGGVRHGALLLALDTRSCVCLLKVGETASIRVRDLATPRFVQVWNSKSREEGWSSRPLARACAWIHCHALASG